MLEIIKQDNKEGYLEIIDGMGLSQGSVRVSEAKDGETVTGYGIYEFLDDRIVIHKISPESDLVLFDGIARSIMFLAVLKGIECAEFGETTLKNARLLRYIKESETALEPISTIFNGCENCKHAGKSNL